MPQEQPARILAESVLDELPQAEQPAHQRSSPYCGLGRRRRFLRIRTRVIASPPRILLRQLPKVLIAEPELVVTGWLIAHKVVVGVLVPAHPATLLPQLTSPLPLSLGLATPLVPRNALTGEEGVEHTLDDQHFPQAALCAAVRAAVRVGAVDKAGHYSTPLQECTDQEPTSGSRLPPWWCG